MSKEKELLYIPTAKEIETKLGVFLPTPEELSSMSEDEFESWVKSAPRTIKQRNKKRNPLPLLRERISSILQDPLITEQYKETEIANIIDEFNEEFRRWFLV